MYLLHQLIHQFKISTTLIQLELELHLLNLTQVDQYLLTTKLLLMMALVVALQLLQVDLLVHTYKHHALFHWIEMKDTTSIFNED